MEKRKNRQIIGAVIYALIIILSFEAMATSNAKELSYVSSAEFYAEGKTLQDVISYQQKGNELTLNLKDNKIVKLNFISPSIVRVRFNRDGNYSVDNSYAVIKSDFGNVDYQIEDQPEKLVVKTSEIRVEVNKSPYGISIYNKDNVLVSADATKAISWNDEGIITHKKIMPGSNFYGFGEKTGTLVKNGLSMTMWNTDAYGYNEGTDPIYISIPFFIETNKDYVCGTLFDNTYQSYFDMGHQKQGQYYFGALDGEINYYFIYGVDVKDIIYKYTELTGRINMPPKWALGYQQSRYSYFPDTRVKGIAKKFRNKKIPCDVLYLDIDFMDGYKSFTWNKKYFKDAPGMIGKLHEQGFKVITIINPGMKAEPGYSAYDSGVKGDHFIKEQNGEYAHGRVWPGDCVFPDYTKPETRQWWGNLYSKLTDIGIDGFWNDMNEPSVFGTKTLPLEVLHYDFGQNSIHAKVHNVYGQQMVRATLEGLDKLRPENRNFVLSRAGYAGIQRYAAVWTGDNTANWDHLKLNIPMVLNMGLSGIPIAGADIGGYADTPTPELLVRWMQLGAFTTLYRNHTATGTSDQEPWAFGKKAENASRKAIELRYKFIQYLYDFVYMSYKTGLPIDRPLFMEFPADKNTYGIEDEFMFGDAMLIAPVVTAGATSREVYLPAGAEWYDYWTGKKYAGGTSYTIEAPLDRIPIFIKAGAIIPIREVVQYTGEKAVNPITFLAYPGSNYQYTLYLDDENTLQYKNGVYKVISISNTMSDNKQIIKFNVIKDGFQQKEPYFYVKLLDASKPSKIKINGEEIKPVANNRDLNSSAEGFYFDPSGKSILIKVNDIKPDLEIEVE